MSINSRFFDQRAITKLGLCGTILSLCSALIGCQPPADQQATDTAMQIKAASKPNTACHNDLIIDSFHQRKSNVQVRGCGRVKAVLPDDNKGSRHQKFIVTLDGSQQTVLIAHNIDLAPRVAGLAKGDTVTFFGEYEYSDKGGVVHWTHHDPAGRHQDGYIQHQSTTYQ